ncbi:MAG: RICIN domain-containing protein [Ruminococcus sp.]|nr:RICIN domain-containing protein [Ruminococcus sp.]
MLSKFKKGLAWLTAFTIGLAGMGGLSNIASEENVVSAADTGSRLLVDINKNDGRKVSHARNAKNWIIDDTASTTINGISFKLTANGGDLRTENNKNLQQQNMTHPFLTMDGVTVDTDNGGTLTLTISGLSSGTHSIKTYHSNTNANGSTGAITLKVNGSTAMTGIECPNAVKDAEDAGIGYATFSGTSATIEISSASGSAWLNAFELDGGDPIKGVNHVSPVDQDAHHEAASGLSWQAGNGAKSHDVYIGTSYNSVFNATTSSSEFKGNQTGTTYALDESYQSVNTYYWRVDTIDGSGNVIKGSVNSFNVTRLAFPTAEGYGRYARGGQGGQVVHVTNLNDSGEGSLRWALCDSQWATEDKKGVPRIVVFDVGGVIELQSTLCIPEDCGNVYVAGQTAPGDGITLINYDFGAMGSSDVIIRNVHVRVGDMNGKSTGGMGLGSCNNSIVDHCSISWATDEGFSSRQAANITFQWNIIGESLNESVHYNADDRTQTEPHSFAASIGGNIGSFHHNLLIDCTGRNWSLAGAMEASSKVYGGQLDIRNNVVYNWRDRTTDGGARRVNFVNNYYKAGSVSNTNMHIFSIDGNELSVDDMQMGYVSGNVMVKTDGSYALKASDDAWAVGKAVCGGKGGATVNDVRSNTQFFEPYVETQSAEEAYQSVIKAAGANALNDTGWDYIDSRYIKEVTNGSYTHTGSKAGLKGIIDSQNDAGGYPSKSNFEHSTNGVCSSANDTDRDGMPNTWETEHGLDPNDASDGCINSMSPDGYTNVEMFLNELAGDDINIGEAPITGKEGAVIDTAYKYSITNVGSGLQLEVQNAAAENGAKIVQGTTGADGWTFEDAGDGYYRIYSEVGDGKSYLLDVPSAQTDNGVEMGIWTDTAHDAQLFKLVDNGDGSYTICTKVTEDQSCLGVAGGSHDEGTKVVQWVCDGTDSQKWILKIMLDPISGSLIQELQPNDAALYKYWSIDTSLEKDDQVFGDRTGEKLVTFATIPDQLIGAEYVITPCDAKNLTTDVATVTAGDDITLYVGLDSRTITQYGVPSWMSTWNETGMSIVNSKDVNFTLYSIDLAKGETITLGQNGGSSGCVFYTVLATKQQEVVLPEAVIYDVTCDNKINIFDLALLKSYIGGETELSDAAILNADANEDGKITIADAVALQKKLLGLA